ncbi:hypothetical protein L218DRAFT_303555, partial [Marasmius fiardii PR-910]
IDRHPHSVEALCTIPSRLPNVDSSSTILTGSSDGFLRAVNIFPTKLHGVVADHGEWPVERIAVSEITRELTLDHDDDSEDISVVREDEQKEDDSPTAGLWWAGSVGHDEVLKLTDLGSFFSKEPTDEDGEEDEDQKDQRDVDSSEDEDGDVSVSVNVEDPGEQEYGREIDSDDQGELGGSRKKRKRKDKDPMSVRKRTVKNEVEVQGAFFDDL